MYVVNAAGLYSDEIHALFGKHNFKVTPRRGQLIIYDKMARRLINHVLLPVPTAKTKGVLISPTVANDSALSDTARRSQAATIRVCRFSIGLGGCMRGRLARPRRGRDIHPLFRYKAVA